MTKTHFLFSLISLLFFLTSCKDQSTDQLDLVVVNAKIWTGNEAMPYANWIAIKGEEIVQIGGAQDSPPEAKQTIDAKGQLTVPGFNDSHIHFESAGSLLLGINLLNVNDEAGLQREIKRSRSDYRKAVGLLEGIGALMKLGI